MRNGTARLSLVQNLSLGAAGLACFFGVWIGLSASGLTPPQFLPSPFAVAARIGYLLQHQFAGATILGHLAASFGRYALGFLLSVAIGVPLGLTMGRFPSLDAAVTPLFDAIRFVAPIAWVPFAALWFGTGIGGPVMIIFAGAFPPCLINAYRGAKFVDRKYIEAAQTLGASEPTIIREILVPAALPSIISGVRVGAGLGWQSLVGAELIVASAGVGYMMVQGQSSVSTTTVLAGMVAIGLVGYVIDVLLRRLEATIAARGAAA
jgi:NitT/TauT family transport system permease protein